MVPAEINEEFFKKLYPQGEVTTIRSALKDKGREEEHEKHYAIKRADTKLQKRCTSSPVLLAELKISVT